MVDCGPLAALLTRIGVELGHLRRLSALTDDELLCDPDRLPAVKYRFVVSIEASIDASRHVALSQGLRAATSFADSFVVLGEAGILEAELVGRLKDMAGFRNLLVHGYAHVDARVSLRPCTTASMTLKTFVDRSRGL